ncbi:hypothetical protein HMPREF3224_00042 [Anaerococcus hydrogenalis]|nr:hypothetical protein HMPREF3224_00042 [Anaerococcus hydrogenalis]
MQIIIKTALKSSLFEDFFVYIVQSCYVSYNLIIVAKPLGLFSIYSGTFNFLLIFYNEFSCSLAFQLSFLFQTSNPKHFSLVGLITLNFVAFTFNPNFFSIHLVTKTITLFATTLFATVSILSSKHQTNLNIIFLFVKSCRSSLPHISM